MKNLTILSLITLILLSYQCTPKVTEQVTEVKEEVKPPKESLVNNPCTTLDELSSIDRDDAETAYVLYRDQIKLKDFPAAYELWKTAYYLAPAANGRVKYQFEDGIKIHKHFYDNTNNPIERKMHYDSIMSIYDKRAECYPDPGYVEGRKAYDMFYSYDEYATTDQVFDLFKQAIDLKGEKADYFIINPMTGMLAERIINKSIDLEEGRTYAMKIFDAIKYGNENCGKNCEAWAVINDYAPPRLENLEGIKDLYDCNYYQEKYYKQFQENPTDCETISRVYARLKWGGCAADDAMVAEVKAAKETNCFTPPPPPGPLKTAFNLYSDGKYLEAVEAFEAFVVGTEDVEKKAKYTLLIAKIYYGDLKQFNKSRAFALKAASFKPNWGDPYILIGKLYASSGPLCGPGRGWDSQIVTWAAIDKFNYAKKIDPSVADEANKWISSYRQYMPTKEDVFFRQLKAGQTFKVPCWIQENTIIRTAD